MRRAAAAGAALLLIALSPHAAGADLRACGEVPPAAVELPAGCALLLARALWLSGDRPTDASIQLQARDAAQDAWIGADKVKHLGVSFMVTLSTQYFLVRRMDLPDDRAWRASAATALAFGLFKELADSQRPHQPLFSWRDMAWNAAGVAAAVAVILL